VVAAQAFHQRRIQRRTQRSSQSERVPDLQNRLQQELCRNAARIWALEEFSRGQGLRSVEGYSSILINQIAVAHAPASPSCLPSGQVEQPSRFIWNARSARLPAQLVLGYRVCAGFDFRYGRTLRRWQLKVSAPPPPAPRMTVLKPRIGPTALQFELRT